MKWLVRALICSVFGSVFILCSTSRPQSSEPAAALTGRVTLTLSYCGGARPSDEMMEEYNRPKPYAQKVLYVKLSDGEGAKPVKVITNDTGFFSVNLQPGNYHLFQEEQLAPPQLGSLRKEGMIEVDSACFAAWVKEPLEIVKITGVGTQSVQINFHRRCFISGDIPCQNYVGPMPP